MRKNITVIGYSIESINIISEQIKNIFGENVFVKNIIVKDLNNENKIYSDLILLPSYSLYNKIKDHFDSENDIVIMSRTISKEGFDKLKSIPRECEIYLIDETKEMAEEICGIIYQLGIKWLKIKPLGINGKPKNNNMRVILDEKKYKDNNIINIGHALLDLNSILEIGIRLDLDEILNKTNLKNAYKEIITSKIGLALILNKTNRFESQLNVMLDSTDDGIIELDKLGNIILCNKNALKIINLERENVINRKGKDLLPSIHLEKILENKEIIKDELVRINNKNVITTVYPIMHSDKFYGTVVNIKEFDEVEKKQHKIRKKLIGKGHRAKYTFNDIIGNSELINECKSIAKRMAKSNSSILITGETGTGKELFAQAIHNESKRKIHQFVAVNCGALPVSILESELFGYEEGAFTGARKGGKLGLFELAHKGTIFLDEIGEMPLNLQMKLLRVLQEKEIMRIGSDRVINIDIRVIAATNKNLDKSIEENKFREDLYYRLKVLPLKIPPLRVRPEDILSLINYYKNKFNGSFKLNNEAKDILLKYNWKGNIRELRNFVEYFINLDKDVIEVKDISINTSNNNYSISTNIGNSIDDFINFAGKNINEYIFVLEVLEKSYRKKERVGRRSIHKQAQDNNIFLSEQRIRKILIDLEKYYLINIGKGRSGSVITNYGLDSLKILKKI